jgi:hypothetical protein
MVASIPTLAALRSNRATIVRSRPKLEALG